MLYKFARFIYYFDDYVCLLLIDGMHVSLMYFLMKLKETLSSVQEVLAITSVLVDTIKRNLKDFAFNGTFLLEVFCIAVSESLPQFISNEYR